MIVTTGAGKASLPPLGHSVAPASNEPDVSAKSIVRSETTAYVPCALCIDITDFECRWSHRGYDANEQAKNHTATTGHPTSVETLTRTEYRP
jgi:hypothetical protein